MRFRRAKVNGMMNVRRLLLLAEACDRGSLTAAAQAMEMTTSAASQQMSLLEREAGQPLLERLPRGVRPTPAGEALAARGRTIRRELHAAKGDVEAFANLGRGTLRLGSFPTASASLLPLALTRFRRQYPDVQTVVRAGVLGRICEMLHAGEVELALLWEYQWNRVEQDAFELSHLLDDPTVLVVPADSELLDHGEVQLEALAEHEWIIRADNHPVADVLRRSCHRAGFEPHIAYESHDYQEAQAMVAAGLGIAIAPRLAVSNHRSDVRLVRFGTDTPAPVRRILLARSRARAATPTTPVMMCMLREAARQFTDFGPDNPCNGAS